MIEVGRRIERNFATRVMGARLTAGLSGRQLAERAGMTSHQITLIECGERAVSLAEAVALALAIGTPLASLLSSELAALPGGAR